MKRIFNSLILALSLFLFSCTGKMSKDKEPTKNTPQKVDFSGVITVKIEAKEGVSVEYLNKRISDTFNSESFKQHITKSVTQIEPTKMKPTK